MKKWERKIAFQMKFGKSLIFLMTWEKMRLTSMRLDAVMRLANVKSLFGLAKMFSVSV